jgi:hypothetical protein
MSSEGLTTILFKSFIIENQKIVVLVLSTTNPLPLNRPVVDIEKAKYSSKSFVDCLVIRICIVSTDLRVLKELDTLATPFGNTTKGQHISIKGVYFRSLESAVTYQIMTEAIPVKTQSIKAYDELGRLIICFDTLNGYLMV